MFSVAIVMALIGCSTSVYQPASDASFTLDSPREITDEDVRKAFLARPQLPERVSVAYYAFDEKRVEAIEQMLRSIPSIRSTYRIPSLLVSGQRRFEDEPWRQPRQAPLSVKQLRLLAARAHADVLLIFDSGHRITYLPNGLVVFGVLLLPMLFVPMQDVEAESYFDSYVIDTRNGYLYGQVSAKREASDDYLLVYSDRGTEMVEGQLAGLMSETRGLLVNLLAHSSGAPSAPAATRAEPESGARAQAPVGGARESGAERPLVISFDGKGGALVDGQPVDSVKSIQQRAEDCARSRLCHVLVKAPPGISYEWVSEVMDMLKEAGVASISIVAEAPAEDAGPEPSPGLPPEEIPVAPSRPSPPEAPLPVERRD